MSGAVTATTVLAATAVAGTAYSIYAGEKAKDAQKEALAQQEEAQAEAAAAAEEQTKLAEENVRAATQKEPDVSKILESAQEEGGGSTMLTGPQGVDPSQLKLGKTSLLGG